MYKDVLFPEYGQFSIIEKIKSMVGTSININTKHRSYKRRIMKGKIDILGVNFDCDFYFIEIKDEKEKQHNVIPYALVVDISGRTNKDSTMIDLANLLTNENFANKVEQTIFDSIKGEDKETKLIEHNPGD